MLSIQGSQSIAQVEAELCELHKSSPTELRLPVHPKDWQLGGENGLIQLAITWARLNDEARLFTHIADNEEPSGQLRKMARRIYGFVALMMASEIFDRSGNRSVRLEANEQCKSVVEMMFRPVSEFALGERVFLISVDHSTRRSIPWLYSNDGVVCDRLEFTSLVKELADRMSRLTNSAPIPLNLYPKFAAILQELFKNTEEWARRDALGRPWRRSVRGLSAQRHLGTSEQFSDIASESPAVNSYLESFMSASGSRKPGFIEFSVFDSGIGLARQQLKETWSLGTTLNDEFLACMKCLRKHSTSSNRMDKGLGLAEVMSTLGSLDAFLKIRTGRLSLYRDFRAEPFRSGDDRLFDFPTCSETPSELALVFGTHFQILIPLSHEG